MTVDGHAVSSVVHRHTIVIPAEARPKLGIKIAGPERKYILQCAADSNGGSAGLKEEDKIVSVNGQEAGNVEELLTACLSSRTAFYVMVERSAMVGKLFRNQFAEIRGTGTRLTARIWLPPDYTPEKAWPMIVFLHDMNVDHDEDGFLYFMMTGRPLSEQAIVFAPICPLNPKFWWFKLNDHNGGDAPEMMDAVVESMEYMCSTFAVDRRFVHVTGSGMGGYATWELILQHPRLFCSAVPCAGHFDGTTEAKFRGSDVRHFISAMNEEKVTKLVANVKSHGIRVWIVHAPIGGRFPFADARYLFERLKQNGCDVTLNHASFVGISEAAIWLYVAQEDEKKTAGNMLSEFFFPDARAPKIKKRSKSRPRVPCDVATAETVAGKLDWPDATNPNPNPNATNGHANGASLDGDDAARNQTTRIQSTRRRPPPAIQAPVCPVGPTASYPVGPPPVQAPTPSR